MPALLAAALLAAAPVAKTILLPGAPGLVAMDYLAVEPSPPRLWVPAGNTGNVDVLDLGTGKVTAIPGFPTASKETPHGTRQVGPSSVALGPTAAFVGNRADSTVCAIDRRTLARGACLALADMPDGIAYVAATQELWITTPHAKSLTLVNVADPAHPKPAGTLALDGEPEGYAVDAEHGRFFTNLEDADQTLTFDVRTRKLLRRVPAGCGAQGPRGLAVDPGKALFVACTDHVVALDAEGPGKPLAQLATGEGVDNLDYLPTRHLLVAAAGKSARLTAARWTEAQKLEPLWQIDGAPGERVVVLAPDGTALATDPQHGRILAVPPTP